MFRNILYQDDKQLMRIEKLREYRGEQTSDRFKRMEQYVDLVFAPSWRTD